MFRWWAAQGGNLNKGVWTSGDYTDASETRSNRPFSCLPNGMAIETEIIS